MLPSSLQSEESGACTADLAKELRNLLMRVLPVVDKMRRNIDELFLQFVGPMGVQDAAMVHRTWLETCRRAGPSGLNEYIRMLSVHVVDTQKQYEFIALAREKINLRN